jgi:ribosome-associated toxin RatA of RatAB toxin-antitoxin module
MGCSCCSTGIAISKIVHVDAPAHILWEVLTDVESYPIFVDTIKSLKIEPPKISSKSITPEASIAAAAMKQQRVKVGTVLCEERTKTRGHYKSFKVRRIVTTVNENLFKNEYSISFTTQFDDEFPKSADMICNTSTLSILPPAEPPAELDVNGNNDSCCTLVGSFAVEIGGTGSNSMAAFCPILWISCCKRQGQQFKSSEGVSSTT